MLKNIGISFVILGHSERRFMGENNQEINQKIKSCLSFGLVPILCVGENDRDENHQYLNFLKNQIEECLSGISKKLVENIVIAYEPVWAIGMNAKRPATAPEFLEVSIFIRKILSDNFGKLVSDKIRIIYGGSVHKENADSFLKEGSTDGFLVGGDSLNAKKFLEIVDITNNYAKY
jgi:triosephosphate isomerase